MTSCPAVRLPRRPVRRRGSVPIERDRVFRAGPVEVPGIGPRALDIYLPPGHDRDTGHRYPVAYMFDGQNVYGDEGSFAGGWRMHLVLDRLAARGHRVPVVVGLHHGGAQRVDELAPWRTGSGGGGKTDLLLDWIAGELSGQVQRNLRVMAGPEHTLVGGSSMGGLTALYAVFRRPETFGSALAMSPSLWVGGGEIFRFIERTPVPWSCKIYLDAGGRERWLMDAARQMNLMLERKGLVGGRHVHFRADPRGGHHERSWRRRLPAALRFLLQSRAC